VEHPNNGNPIYVFTKDAINRAVAKLTLNPTHEHVPGYLAIMRAQAGQSDLPGRSSDIVNVYDRYLRIQGGTEKQPYVRPFMSRGKGLKMSNRNVAGSYAISNRRAGGPYFQVVDVTGEKQDTEYRLTNDHANLAMTHLLQGNKLPIVSTTVFFYRDYGFELETPAVRAVAKLFRAEFGLQEAAPAQKSAYDTLFYDDSLGFSDEDLIKLEEATNG
jgi:hypothetical protein